ncbi:MAG: ABC transporter permease, partial [Myxococcota bacterium]
FRRVRRAQRRTKGRGRLLALAVLGPLTCVTGVAAFLLLGAGMNDALINPITGVVEYADFTSAHSQVGFAALVAAAGIDILLRSAIKVLLISCWFLIPVVVRRALWLTFDLLLTALVTGIVATTVWMTEPLSLVEAVTAYRLVAVPLVIGIVGVVLGLLAKHRAPKWSWLSEWGGRIAMLVVGVSSWFLLDFDVGDGDVPALIRATVQLSVVALLALRTLVRFMPPILDGIEAMGFRTFVAARHLRSKKSDFLATISILSILAVTVSSAALCMVLSVMGGFRQDLKRKILGNNAHVVVDLDHETFTQWEPVLQAARDTEGVVGASPYVSGEVMVTSATNLAGAVLRGIDPHTVSDVIDLRSNITRGDLDYLTDPEALLNHPDDFGPLPMDMPLFDGSGDPPENSNPSNGPIGDLGELLDAPPGTEFGPDPDSAIPIDEALRNGPSPASSPREVLPGIIVGQELARSLRLYVGDEVNVVSPFGDLGPAGPIPKSRPFRVAGIFYSGMYEYDMKYMYVTLPTAQRFLSTGEEISGVEVKVADIDDAPAIGQRVARNIGRDDLRVRDWQELNKNLFGALALEKLAMFITLGLAVLVAGFCVLGTLTLMVQEKGREVGILKAMGTRSRDVVGIFMFEGFLIGVFGAGLGLGIGYVLCFAAEHFGIRMNPEVYYIDRLPVHIDPSEFLMVALTAVGMCLLATVFPALVASLQKPVEAIRFD